MSSTVHATVHAPIGLVLSGGGAKGAYQAGVWKAMVETGVGEWVAAISGTSVGAINAAAIATIRDPDRIREIWLGKIASVVSPNVKAFSPRELLDALGRWTDGEQFPLRGILDRDRVEAILAEELPREWPTGSPAVHATALEARGASGGEWDRSSYARTRFRIDREADPDRRRRQLLASCAIPWCYSPVEIGGKRYVDGGWNAMGGENTPVEPLLRNHPDIRTVVVVRCNSRDLDPEPLRVPRPKGLRVLEIRPTKPLPGIFTPGLAGGAFLASTIFPAFGGPLGSLLLAAFSGTRTAKVWGATLAFSPSFASQFFDAGHRDALDALASIVPPSGHQKRS